MRPLLLDSTGAGTGINGAVYSELARSPSFKAGACQLGRLVFAGSCVRWMSSDGRGHPMMFIRDFLSKTYRIVHFQSLSGLCR